MKAGKVLELLQISRPTLKRYRERGYLRAAKRPSGQFDYNADDVFLMMNRDLPHRYIITYSRVSTYHHTAVHNTLDDTDGSTIVFKSKHTYKIFKQFEFSTSAMY